VISLNALIGIVTQPHTMGNCAAGKTEFEGSVGFMGGSLLKRVCTVAWCLTGLAAVVYFRNRNVEADKAFGMVAGEFLTGIGWGVLGLFIAALLAAVMSSCDSFMIASAGLLTVNVYKPLRPGRSDRHYLLVARLSSLGVVAVGVGLAYTLKNVMAGLVLFWKVAAMMGIAFWLGLFWRRATVAAAWASTLAAFAVLLLTMTSPVISGFYHAPGSKTLHLVNVKATAGTGPQLRECDLKDPEKLVGKLRDRFGPLSRHLSSETKDLLRQHVGGPVSKALVRSVLDDLNRIITSKQPTGKTLPRLGRRLIEETYPDEIRKSFLFGPGDISMPRVLASRLREAADPVSRHVSERMSDETKAMISAPERYGPKALAKALAADLNRIAQGGDLYDVVRFEGVHLCRMTASLARKSPEGEDLVRLNTYLIEEAFYRHISKNREVQVYLPWQMVFYLLVGLVVGIAVSFYTSPVDEEKLDRFYALVRTPVKEGEEVPEACTLPDGVEAPPSKPAFPNTKLEIQVPRARSFIGFGVGWAIVITMILVFVWIAKG
jgi:hypothetical protein